MTTLTTRIDAVLNAADRTTEGTARLAEWLRLQAVTGGWHPDDTAATIVNGRTGQPLFTPEQADRADALTETAFRVAGAHRVDLYGASLDVVNLGEGIDAHVVVDAILDRNGRDIADCEECGERAIRSQGPYRDIDRNAAWLCDRCWDMLPDGEATLIRAGFEPGAGGMWHRWDDVYETVVTVEGDGILRIGVFSGDEGSDGEPDLDFEVNAKTWEIVSTADDRPLDDETLVSVRDMVRRPA